MPSGVQIDVSPEQIESLTYNLDGLIPAIAQDHETREILSGWQDAVLKLGAEPKGIFTVDFRSPDPNVLWCWTVDEPKITHRHFTWESFKDRITLEVGERVWPSAN